MNRRAFVILLLAVVVVLCYVGRLFGLQILSDNYKRYAESNAFLNKVRYPARGLIMDRNGDLLVYNEPAYTIMVVMQEQHGVDTLGFCEALGITREQYIRRMDDIKDPAKNPGYSRFTPQVFMTGLSATEYSAFQEQLFKFNGFSVERRSVRHYATNVAALLLGDVAEVSPSDIEQDPYYRAGDMIGKLGIERAYEQQLRGEKGVSIMLRDVRGRIKGSYADGEFDRVPRPGSNLTLGIDLPLQELGERLMEGKIGSIVAIEPATGEVLCMVSAPTFDPHLLSGSARSKNYAVLAQDRRKPLLNRAIMGQYPPGSTFKPAQGLMLLQEGVVTTSTLFPCSHGFRLGRTHVGCHGHGSPISLVPALQTSCNGYFCWGLHRMLGMRKKYGTTAKAFTVWKDYMVSMGFGYRLGIDLPGEKRGFIPNADYYDSHYGEGRWSALTIISDAIGQGEVMLTPLQIANLCATIANRGYYHVPHVVSRVDNNKLDTIYTSRHYTAVDERYYNIVVEGMRRAVLGGTCRGANIPGIEVCGKTGTAENRGQDHSVFMGFAPKDDPQIAIAVYVENGGYGASTAVPIGSLMIEQYINDSLSVASRQRADLMQQKSIYYGSAVR